MLSSLGNAWGFDTSGHLEKRFACKDFVAALSLANRVGAIAEEEAHHPDLHVRWGELRVEIWTHKIDGLTESDFILAAKIDRALDSQT